MTEKAQIVFNSPQVQNPNLRDSSSKIIFADHILSSQFLRDYADLEILRQIRPEDIEDVSERYVPLYSTERNSDTVKRVDLSKYLPVRECRTEDSLSASDPIKCRRTDTANLQGLPLYIISLVEHKTKVEYNVVMQILRYMVHIWEDYEKEMDRMRPGISRRKGFRYPPILPMVYYEGTDRWTAPEDLADKIYHGKLLGKYLPHFRYQLVNLHDFSNEELLERGDEISLAMLINKIQTFEDMSEFTGLSEEKLESILRNTPEHLLETLANVLRALLYHMNLSENEVEGAVAKIKERKMGLLFENAKLDILEERRKVEIERQKLAQVQQEAARVQQEAEKAQQEAEKAQQEAEKAQQEAEKAQQEAEKAQQEAAQSQQRAADLQKELQTAQQDREAAQLDQAIVCHILRMLRQGNSDEEITQSIMQRFSLKREQAAEKLNLAFGE